MLLFTHFQSSWFEKNYGFQTFLNQNCRTVLYRSQCNLKTNRSYLTYYFDAFNWSLSYRLISYVNETSHLDVSPNYSHCKITVVFHWPEPSRKVSWRAKTPEMEKFQPYFSVFLLSQPNSQWNYVVFNLIKRKFVSIF